MLPAYRLSSGPPVTMAANPLAPVAGGAAAGAGAGGGGGAGGGAGAGAGAGAGVGIGVAMSPAGVVGGGSKQDRMPGSVTSELFLFLVDAGLLSRTDELEPASADGALVWLPARIHDSLCNGTFVASVVREVRTRCGLGGEPLATLQGSSYTSRAFNWSSVLASLEHDLSLTVDKPTRQKLNSGDMATATLVLSALCEAIVDHIGVPDDGVTDISHALCESLLDSDADSSGDESVPSDADMTAVGVAAPGAVWDGDGTGGGSDTADARSRLRSSAGGGAGAGAGAGGSSSSARTAGAQVSGAALIASSCGEFVVLSLAQHLGLTVEQATTLLHEHPAHLATFFVAGTRTQMQATATKSGTAVLQALEGAAALSERSKDGMAANGAPQDFRQPISWLREVYAALPQVTTWLRTSNDPPSHGDLLQCIQAALQSDSVEVVRHAARVLSEVCRRLQDSDEAAFVGTIRRKRAASPPHPFFERIWAWMSGAPSASAAAAQARGGEGAIDYGHDGLATTGVAALVSAWRNHRGITIRRQVLGAVLWCSFSSPVELLSVKLSEATGAEHEKLSVLVDIIRLVQQAGSFNATQGADSARGTTTAAALAASAQTGLASPSSAPSPHSSMHPAVVTAFVKALKSCCVQLFEECTFVANGRKAASGDNDGTWLAGRTKASAISATGRSVTARGFGPGGTQPSVEVDIASERVVAIELLTELWVNFPSRIEPHPTAPVAGLAALRHAIRSNDSGVAVVAVGGFCRLLHMFCSAKTQHVSAPVVYKALIFATFEFYARTKRRSKRPAASMLLDNLVSLLEALPTLPVGIVVEPVCNLLQARGMKAVDLGLMHLQHVLAAHPRLSLRTGLKLAEAAGQIVIKGAVFRTTAAQVLHALLKRFQSAQSMVAFLQHWAAAALVIAYQVGEQQHDVQPAASPRRRGEARGKRGKRHQRRETSAGREGDLRRAETQHLRNTLAALLAGVLSLPKGRGYRNRLRTVLVAEIAEILEAAHPRWQELPIAELMELAPRELVALLERAGGSAGDVAVTLQEVMQARQAVHDDGDGDAEAYGGDGDDSEDHAEWDAASPQMSPPPKRRQRSSHQQQPQQQPQQSGQGSTDSPESPIYRQVGYVRRASIAEKHGKQMQMQHHQHARRRDRGYSDEGAPHPQGDEVPQRRRSDAEAGFRPGDIGAKSKVDSATARAERNRRRREYAEAVRAQARRGGGGGAPRRQADGRSRATSHDRDSGQDDDGQLPSARSRNRRSNRARNQGVARQHHSPIRLPAAAGASPAPSPSPSPSAAAPSPAPAPQRKSRKSRQSKKAAAGPKKVVPGSEVSAEVGAVIKECKKGLKTIFTRYAGTQSKNQQASFDAFSKAAMSLGELTKCLKELDVYPALLSRAELMIAFRACASRAVNAKALVVQQFAACMARVALFATSHQSMRGAFEAVAVGDRVRSVFWELQLHDYAALKRRLRDVDRDLATKKVGRRRGSLAQTLRQGLAARGASSAHSDPGGARVGAGVEPAAAAAASGAGGAGGSGSIHSAPPLGGAGSSPQGKESKED